MKNFAYILTILILLAACAPTPQDVQKSQAVRSSLMPKVTKQSSTSTIGKNS